MGRSSLSRLGVMALAGATIVGCNILLVQYDDGYSTENASSGGSGGRSSSSSSSSGGGTGGHTGGDAGHGADADAGPDPGYTLWAKGFGSEMIDETVNAVAVGGAQDHIFITGRADYPKVFGCPTGVPDMDAAAAATGYLVELDPADGKCLWAFFFGADAEGTAIAADGNGNIVLGGTYRGSLAIDPNWTMASAGVDAFVARFDQAHALQWVRRVGETGGTGDQRITSVAMSMTEIAVAGSYDRALRISGPSPFPNVDPSGATPDGVDAFALLFDMNGGVMTTLPVSSPSGMTSQVGTGVAVRDTDGAFAITGTTEGSARFNGSLLTATGSDKSVFLAAYDSGKIEKLKLLIGDTDIQHGRQAAFDGNGDIVITGGFLGTVLAAGQGGDAGPSIANVGGLDVFVARYHDNGDPSGILQLGLDTQGSNNAMVGGMAIYENKVDVMNKAVHLAGGFTGTFGVNGVPTVSATGANNDIFVAKVAFDLAKGTWVKSFGDASEQAATGVAVDTKGNTIVVGHYQGTVDFGVSNHLTNSGVGANDIFVAKLAP